jgi:hypothetical protein
MVSTSNSFSLNSLRSQFAVLRIFPHAVRSSSRCPDGVRVGLWPGESHAAEFELDMVGLFSAPESLDSYGGRTQVRQDDSGSAEEICRCEVELGFDDSG